MPISNKKADEFVSRLNKGEKLTDEELGSLNETTELDLSKICVDSLNCLADLSYREEPALKNLETLYLNGAQVGSWKGLGRLESIQKLYLIGSNIASLKNLRGLTNLKTLDLGGTQIDSLQGLENLPNLEELLLRGTNIRSLENLVGLKKLKKLDLTRTQVNSLECLGNLKKLQTLYLRGTLVNSFECLQELPELQNLDLRRTQVSSLEGFERFKNLKTLYLRGTNVVSLERLKNLKKLLELDLSYTQVNSLGSLKDLENLQRLYLNGTPIDSIAPLSGLKNLLELNLRETNVGSLEPLQGLKKLETLDLSGTPIDSESLEHVRNLTNLQHLCLNETRVASLEPLGGLEQLQTLWLDSTPVASLEWLGKLEELRELYLSETKVYSLESLGNLTKLQTLDLRGTQVRSLSRLASLKNLNKLYIARTSLDCVPKFLFDRNVPFKAEEEWGIDPGVYMRDVQLYEQPVSLFSQSNDLTKTYYEEEHIPVNEAKVIFLGDGGVGKTHTIYRIEHNGEKPDEDGTTPGVSITQYCHNGRATINFWDFGGQEIMHSMHRCFLTERTCYVVVVSNRWSDVTRQARRWLKNIESFAPDSKIILAVNRWENVPVWDLDKKRLRKEFPRLGDVVEYTATGSLEELTQEIEKEVDSMHSVMMKLPKSWVSIMTRLRDMANDALHPSNYITRKEYDEICADAGVKNGDISRWLLEWFNDLGVCFSYENVKNDKRPLEYMLLNPVWLTNAVYVIVNNGRGVDKAGCVAHETLLDILNAQTNNRVVKGLKYEKDELAYILNVMRIYQLSLEIPNEEKEFVPALCSNEAPEDLEPKKYRRRIRCELRYDYLPDTVVQRLIVSWGQKCQFDENTRCNCNKSWLKGLCIDQTRNCGLFAVCDMGRGDDVLYVDVYLVDSVKNSEKCVNPQALLRLLLNKLEKINYDLNLKSTTWICSNDERKAAFQATTLLRALRQGKETIQYTSDGDFTEYNIREFLGQIFSDPIEIRYLSSDFSRLSENRHKDEIEKFVNDNPFLNPILEKVVS